MKKIIMICALLLTQSVYAKDTMDQVYQQLINKNKDNKKYVKEIKEVQKKWHEFLQAQTDIMYHGWIGTEQQQCARDYKKDLEVAITNESKILFASNDGDICGI